MLSQLTGLLAAAAVGGDVGTGSKIAENATTFNYLFHAELLEREQKLNTCASPTDCQAVRDYYNNLDATRNREFGQYCQQNPTACLQVTRQLADEIPANEKLLHDGRSAGLDRSAALWELTRSNERAINIGIVEKTRTENGDGAAFLVELASDGLNPDRGLFASTAGGKGGTTGVKVGVVGTDGIKGTGDWAKLSGQLTEATKGKGNFGIGSGTSEQADVMGKAWVGGGYKVASDGKTLVSQDGLRQYRPPTYKPNRQGTQANFEQRFPGQETKKWQSNAHLDITD
ncbi:VENN motif pre-toxin domain-containing protein [Pseudomonas kielensis]|uniref:VENN motif pre-toxin domain-containing protein n=1 Tax=Pseudomonas kielensis TaxID=2762577 RepID=UPI00389C1565